MWIFLLCSVIFILGYILGAVMSEGRKADEFVERKGKGDKDA